jgi:hypothetical protein
LAADEQAKKHVFAALEQTGAASIAGMRLSRSQILKFWPEQFSRSAGESPHLRPVACRTVNW